jgi:transglutaminase-like putative cysteine protease
MKKIKRFLALTMSCFILFAFGVFTSQEREILDVKVRITERISIPYLTSGLYVELYLPSDYTNGANIQKITSVNLGSVLGGNYTKKIIKDVNGNSKLVFAFTNPTGEVFIDYGFSFSARVNPLKNKFFASYPMSTAKLKKYSGYLFFTHKAQNPNLIIRSIVQNLVNGKDKLYKAVLDIVFWVKKNIINDPSVRYDDAFTTFLNKRGNLNGIINLTVMMLRSAKIPTRVASGITIDKNIYYKVGERYIEVKYPKGEYKWIEVFSPTRAWLPLDIFGHMFFVPENFIRFSSGLDTGSVSNVCRFSNGYSPPSAKNYFYEQMSAAENLDVNSYHSEGRYLLIFPSVNEYNYWNKISGTAFDPNFHRGNYYPHKDVPSYLLYSHNLSDRARSDYQGAIKIKVAKNKVYAQQVGFQNGFFLDYAAFPIYIEGIYPAKIWVEVYADDNGKPGKFYARSYISKIQGQFSSSSVARKFFFNREAWPYLKKGKYWFALKTDESSQFYWYGVFSNPVGTATDTLSTKVNNWDVITHADLFIEIGGNYFKRP